MHRERTERSSIKTHKFRHWPVGLTAVSCPSLLHPRDGTVGKNKGTVTGISHAPPTSPSYPMRKSVQGDIIPKRTLLAYTKSLFFLNLGTTWHLAKCGGNTWNWREKQKVSFLVCRTRQADLKVSDSHFHTNKGSQWPVLIFFFIDLKIWENIRLTSRMCSSCCSLSSFLEVVVTRPVEDTNKNKINKTNKLNLLHESFSALM